jgi:phosphoribosylanthranilate isomerase
MATVKICGVNSEAAFDAAAQAGAEYIGFVFFPPSPRYVTAAQAAALSARHPGGPARVGLFVDPKPAEIEAVLAHVPLDVLQVHAPAAEIAALKARFGLPVWQALGVESAADFPAPDSAADGFIVEAKPPAGATRPGGNAVMADWDLLAGFPKGKFWLLAGGLTPGNVAEALRRTGAPGADVSSGVESAPGVKSAAFIREFVKQVKEVAFL